MRVASLPQAVASPAVLAREPEARGQGRSHNLDPLAQRFQTILGLTALIAILLSALALGANRPVSWSLLALFITGLFAGQIALDALTGVSVRARTIWLPAILYLAAVLWGLVQTWPDLWPAGIHPFWTALPADIAVTAPNTISADPGAGIHHVMRLMTYAMVFWIGLRVCEDAARALTCLKVIALFSTGLALFGLYAHTTGFNPILDSAASGNLSASFVNRNSYATFALIGILSNLALVSRRLSRSNTALRASARLRNTLEAFFSGTWVFAFGLLICSAALTLTQSRAGGAAALIGIAVFWVGYNFRRSLAGPVVTGLLVFILGFVGLVTGGGLANRLLASADEDARFDIYPGILANIWERPWLGHGLGAFQDVFRASVPLKRATAEWDFAHSSYLENALELGLPAAAVFYLALALIGLRLLSGLKTRRRDREYSSVALAILIAAGFHACVDFSLQMPATAALFAWILGMGSAQSLPTRRT